MILAAADYAEGKPDSQPPPELEYAWQCQSHPGALPNAGGLRDQPFALMRRMSACLNVYMAIKDYTSSDLSVTWIEKNRSKYDVFLKINKLRRYIEENS